MYRHLVSTVALLLFALLAGPAQAVVYCIDTTAELNSAISSANNAAEGTTHELKLRPGTYAVPNGIWFEPAGDKDAKTFSMTGGWNSDCSARTINASATVINGEAPDLDGPMLFMGNNTYTIEGIRFINYGSFLAFDPSCDFSCPDTAHIRIRYNEFRNGLAWAISTQDAGQLIVTNNLVAGLSGGGFGGVASIYYYNADSRPIVAFNTFADISCGPDNDAALDLLTEIANPTFHHNIVQSSCASDIDLSTFGQAWQLRSNHYQQRSGSPPSASSGNVIGSNPGFIDPAAGDYRPSESAPQSAVINAGMTPAEAAAFGVAGTIPSQDIDGPAGLRQIGTRYDIGAYESSINDASVLTVTKDDDTADGVCNSDCSLREAITVANASAGMQRIEFDIPGVCTNTPHIIQLDSALPDIVDDLEIDGYSQPGTSANTQETGSDAVICLVLVSQSGTLPQAFQVPQAAPADTQLTLKGLAFGTGFGNFTVAVRLRGGSGHLIQGNAFGGIGPGNLGPLGSLNFGLQIRNAAQNVLVGGADPEHRNSFGGTLSSTIVINDSTSGGHRIENNYIGVSPSGLVASPIGLQGIFASGAANIEIIGNVVAAVPGSAAISIQGATATGYVIQRNRIGTSANGIPGPTFRNGMGISFAGDSSNHEIGSVLGMQNSNVITNSSDAGVRICDTCSGILIRPNQIFGNGIDGVGLNIDLGVLGPLANDPGDADGGANQGQNHPIVLASTLNLDGTRQVTVSLDSLAETPFRIDVYRAPSCPGGNRGGDLYTRIGTVTTTTDAGGSSQFSFAMSGGAPGHLVAIATNLDSGDTSEPGPCFDESGPSDLIFADSFD